MDITIGAKVTTNEPIKAITVYPGPPQADMPVLMPGRHAEVLDVWHTVPGGAAYIKWYAAIDGRGNDCRGICSLRYLSVVEPVS